MRVSLGRDSQHRHWWHDWNTRNSKILD